MEGPPKVTLEYNIERLRDAIMFPPDGIEDLLSDPVERAKIQAQVAKLVALHHLGARLDLETLQLGLT